MGNQGEDGGQAPQLSVPALMALPASIAKLLNRHDLAQRFRRRRRRHREISLDDLDERGPPLIFDDLLGAAYLARSEGRPAYKRAFDAQLAANAGEPPTAS